MIYNPNFFILTNDIAPRWYFFRLGSDYLESRSQLIMIRVTIAGKKKNAG